MVNRTTFSNVSGVRKMSENEDIAQLTFPEKLWYLVNEPKCDDIEWGPDGLSIVVTDSQEFSKNILNNPSKAYFKTKNLTSFVRQLNLYGFRKVSDHKRVGDSRYDPNRCEFRHPSFRKGRKDLLEEVKRHQNHSKKEESPSEEKPYTTPPNNIPPYPSQYFPVNSMSSPFSMWTNWDAYLQAMGLFPYLPTVSSQCGFVDMPSATQVPDYYGREAMGLPYGGYMPPYYQMPQCGYNTDMSALNTNGVDTITNESKPVDSSSVSLPTVKVTPTKSSVVIINNTLSSSRDVPNESGCYGKYDVRKCDVTNPTKAANSADSDGCVCRGVQEAKKPIPADQRPEVSTCTKTGAAQDWHRSDIACSSRSPHDVHSRITDIQTKKTKIKLIEGKPFDKEKQNLDCARERETEIESYHRRKRVRFEMNGEH